MGWNLWIDIVLYQNRKHPSHTLFLLVVKVCPSCGNQSLFSLENIRLGKNWYGWFQLKDCYLLANFQSTIWFLGRTSNILQNASKSGLAFCGFMVLSPALMGTTSFSGNSSYCSDLKEFPRHRILSSYQTWLVLELSYCIFSRGLVLFHVYCACNWGKYACINQLEKRKNCYFHEFMRDIFVKLTWNVKDIKK